MTPWKRMVMGVMAAVAMILMLEAASRVIKTVGDDLHAGDRRWFAFSPALGWTRTPHFKGQVNGVYREFDANGYLAVDTPKIQDTSRPKVLVLGDSNAFGYRLETRDTYAERLQVLLPEASVINLGVIGYTSCQGLITADRAIKELHPAALIVSFNFNDRRYVVSPDQVDGEENFRSIARADRLHRTMRNIYLVRVLGALTGRESLLDDDDSSDDNDLKNFRSTLTDVSVESLHSRVDPDPYRENLTRIAKMAAAQGIPVIFLLLKDNPQQAAPIHTSARLLEEGKTQEAVDLLKSNSGRTGYYSLLARRMLVAAYRKTDRAAEAEQINTIDYPAFSLNGGTPIQLDTEYNRIMTEVAQASGQDAVDAGSVLEKTPEEYMDYCHLNAPGHQAIANMLYEPVRKALQKRRPPAAVPARP